MSGYYQRDALERTAVLKGKRILCDGNVKIHGEWTRCNQVLAEDINPGAPEKHIVQCRRCNKRHVL